MKRAERIVGTSLILIVGIVPLFWSCSPVRMSQQSLPKPDTVTVTVDIRKRFSVSVSDAIPNENGSWNDVIGATVSLLGTDQVRIVDPEVNFGQLYFYDVPEVFTLRATHPDYEPVEVRVDMKEKKRRAPNRPHYGATILLERKKDK